MDDTTSRSLYWEVGPYNGSRGSVYGSLNVYTRKRTQEPVRWIGVGPGTRRDMSLSRLDLPVSLEFLGKGRQLGRTMERRADFCLDDGR